MSDAFIDWLSFTVPVIMVSKVDWGKNVEESIEAVIPGFLDECTKDWEHGVGRAPYAASFRCPGIGIYYHQEINHILVEVSGQGCNDMGEKALLETLPKIIGAITRIDIARDHKGYCIPGYVLKKTPVGRFKARSLIESGTGVTAYIGSRKSGQFCRIYRYGKPHPRANITRVEYVARKEYARKIAKATLVDGLGSVYASVVQRFSLPACVGNGARVTDIRVERKGRKASRTLVWLISSVVPAIRRLVDEGEINLDEFVAEYLR